MADTTIEYCDKSWNPLAMRCSPVSPGCEHCWHMGMAKRLAGNLSLPANCRKAYAGGEPVMRNKILREPLGWRAVKRVAVQFMGDWMHPDVPIAFIDSMLEVMAACPQHQFLTLTKRPELLEEKLYGVTPECGCRELGGGDYLPNVILGASVEDQPRADERLPHLMKLAAAGWKTMVSYEPALSAVDFSPYLPGCYRCGSPHWNSGGRLGAHCCRCDADVYPGHLDWVVVGGESGPGARPMNPAWARKVRDDCQAAGTPCFIKQLHVNGKLTKNLEEFPADLRIREFPTWQEAPAPVGKKAAGRVLDGRTWDELPKGDEHA